MNTPNSEYHHQGHDENSHHPSPSRSKWVFIGFALIAGYFLVTEHRAHLVGLVPFLPFLLLLACPLMHMFHHGGHHHDEPRGKEGSDNSSKEQQ